jgi:4-hydroxy-3-methylbut-2-enyl diphosphate reductase
MGRGQKGIYTIGPLIHNPQVIEELRSRGIEVASSPAELKRKGARTVIIRTHGLVLGTQERLRRAGFNIVDATCPFVKKAQQYARALKEEGYQVLILGDIEHPEVQSLKSYAGRAAVVVKEPQSLPRLKGRVGIVVQTTQPLRALKSLVQKCLEQVKELKVYNTICSSTAFRLREAEELAKEVDMMVVVGGRNSANTTQLARLCAGLCPATYHIETAQELSPAMLEGVSKVGITAGASTPDWLIKEVIGALKELARRKRA